MLPSEYERVQAAAKYSPIISKHHTRISLPSPKKAEIGKYIILSYLILNKHPSQLQVVLQEHLHQDTFPRQTEPPFVEQLNVFGQCHSAGGIVFWASKPEKGNETWVLFHFLSTVSFCKTTWRLAMARVSSFQRSLD